MPAVYDRVALAIEAEAGPSAILGDDPIATVNDVAAFQSAAIGYAVFAQLNWMETGGTLDKAAFDTGAPGTGAMIISAQSTPGATAFRPLRWSGRRGASPSAARPALPCSPATS